MRTRARPVCHFCAPVYLADLGAWRSSSYRRHLRAGEALLTEGAECLGAEPAAPLHALLDAAREARHAAQALRWRAGTGRAPAARSFSIALLPALPPRTPPPSPPPPPPASESDVPMREATPAPVERGASATPSVDMLVEGLLERPGPLLPRTTPRRLSAGRHSWEVCAEAVSGYRACSARLRMTPWLGSRPRQSEGGVSKAQPINALRVCMRPGTAAEGADVATKRVLIVRAEVHAQ